MSRVLRTRTDVGRKQQFLARAKKDVHEAAAMIKRAQRKAALKAQGLTPEEIQKIMADELARGVVDAEVAQEAVAEEAGKRRWGTMKAAIATAAMTGGMSEQAAAVVDVA